MRMYIMACKYHAGYMESGGGSSGRKTRSCDKECEMEMLLPRHIFQRQTSINEIIGQVVPIFFAKIAIFPGPKFPSQIIYL